MAKLTPEMKELVAKQQCFVATVSADGTPNLGPKMSTRVLDDEHLAYNEITGKKTWENIKANPRVAVAVVDREKLQGYRFVGNAEVITSGLLFDKARDLSQKMRLALPKAVIKVKVDKIYNLGLPGSGEPIAS